MSSSVLHQCNYTGSYTEYNELQSYIHSLSHKTLLPHMTPRQADTYSGPVLGGVNCYVSLSFLCADLFQKIPLGECPLSLRLMAGPDPEQLTFVLKENETGEVEVRKHYARAHTHTPKPLNILLWFEKKITTCFSPFPSLSFFPSSLSFSLPPSLSFSLYLSDSGMHSQSLSCRTSWLSWGKRRLSASEWWSRDTPCIDGNYSRRYSNMTPDPSPVTL